jgi:hypothetical protein
VIPEQFSSSRETLAFLNGGMRMSQRPRLSRPAFPRQMSAAGARRVRGRVVGCRARGLTPARRPRTQVSTPDPDTDRPVGSRRRAFRSPELTGATAQDSRSPGEVQTGTKALVSDSGCTVATGP